MLAGCPTDPLPLRPPTAPALALLPCLVGSASIHPGPSAALRLLQMSKMGLKDVREEILGGRQGLADCGIPIQSIVGFRAPYLETKPDIRMVLKNNGYLYDRWVQIEA